MVVKAAKERTVFCLFVCLGGWLVGWVLVCLVGFLPTQNSMGN